MLDTTIFVGILILALTYLYIENVRTSADLSFIQESEDLNERAIRTLEVLTQSSVGELEIKSIQPNSMQPSRNLISNNLKQIMTYMDLGVAILNQMEEDVKRGRKDIALSESNVRALAHIKTRIGELEDYLELSDNLLSDVEGVLGSSNSVKESVCQVVSELGKMFTTYGDSWDCENSLELGFLEDLSNAILNATLILEKEKSDLEDGLEELDGLGDLVDDELQKFVHDLRCELESIRQLADTYLNYFEIGLNVRASLLDLWPVEANVERLTLGEAIRHSLLVRGNLVSSDEIRTVIAGAGLLFFRNKDVDFDLADLELPLGNMSMEGVVDENETVKVVPKGDLISTGPNSVEAPYYELNFGAECYLTGARKLAVRLKAWGDGIAGEKHKTKYFNDMEYILSTPAYLTSTHRRTYNGSFIKGQVVEDLVEITENFTIINLADGVIKEVAKLTVLTLTRSMEANLVFVYENLTWPPEDYFFDVLHIRTTKESNYTLEAGNQSWEDDEDAAKSIALGFAFADRSDLKKIIREAIKDRLDNLLEKHGYSYKFEAKDCCANSIEINSGLKPVGRAGISKSYFMISEGNRGEMKLTIWRE